MSSLNDMLGGLIGNLTGGDDDARAAGAPQSRTAQNDNSLVELAAQLIQKHGGIGGLISAVKNGGLGDKVDSWIGTGENKSVSPDEVTNVFGEDEIDDLAARSGLPREQAKSGLAAVLPGLIDKLTPDGQVDNNLDDMLRKGMGGLFR